MCIAILNPPRINIIKDTLKKCWENNNDGAGMLWVENNVLKSFKEIKSFDKFYKVYRAVRAKAPDSNIVLHFRISTSGEINDTNTHPFFVNPHVAFVHNGIIRSMELSKEFSDTYMLNEKILKKLPRNFMKNEAIKTLLAEFVDASKLLFLNDKNEFLIINEGLGHWHDKCWWSNYTYSYSYASCGSYGNYGNSSDWYTEGSYQRSLKADEENGKVYHDADFCAGCGTVLRTEYEHRYMMCQNCMDELKEEVDNKYLIEFETEEGKPINEKDN